MEKEQSKSFVERTRLKRSLNSTTAKNDLIDALGGEALQGSGFEGEQPEAAFDNSEHREGTETRQDAVPVSPTGQDAALYTWRAVDRVERRLHSMCVSAGIEGNANVYLFATLQGVKVIRCFRGVGCRAEYLVLVGLECLDPRNHIGGMSIRLMRMPHSL